MPTKLDTRELLKLVSKKHVREILSVLESRAEPISEREIEYDHIKAKIGVPLKSSVRAGLVLQTGDHHYYRYTLSPTGLSVLSVIRKLDEVLLLA